MITFEEFQGRRKWADNLQTALGFCLGDEDETLPGFTYGDLYIFANGGGASPALYTLEWMGEQDVSADLETLERKLFKLASEEGWIS